MHNLSYATINILVHHLLKLNDITNPELAYTFYFSKEPTLYDANEIGQILFDENYRSVNDLYGSTTKVQIFIYNPSAKHLKNVSDLDILNIITDCMLQSNQSSDYENSIAYKILIWIHLKTTSNFLNNYSRENNIQLKFDMY